MDKSMKKVVKFFSDTWDYTVIEHREYYILVDNQGEDVELLTEEELREQMKYTLTGVISNQCDNDFRTKCIGMLARI